MLTQDILNSQGKLNRESNLKQSNINKLKEDSMYRLIEISKVMKELKNI